MQKTKRRKLSVVSTWHYVRLIYRSVLFVLLLISYIRFRFSNTTLQIWRVVQPNVPTINVVVDMVAPQRRIAKIIGGEVDVKA